MTLRQKEMPKLVNVTDETHAELKRLSKVTGMPMYQIIAAALSGFDARAAIRARIAKLQADLESA